MPNCTVLPSVGNCFLPQRHADAENYLFRGCSMIEPVFGRLAGAFLPVQTGICQKRRNGRRQRWNNDGTFGTLHGCFYWLFYIFCLDR